MKQPAAGDLRGLADEMDKLERMERWAADLPAAGEITLGVHISWDWASSCTGYGDFVGAVRQELRDGLMRDLLTGVLIKQRLKVLELKQQILGDES